MLPEEPDVILSAEVEPSGVTAIVAAQALKLDVIFLHLHSIAGRNMHKIMRNDVIKMRHADWSDARLDHSCSRLHARAWGQPPAVYIINAFVLWSATNQTHTIVIPSNTQTAVTCLIKKVKLDHSASEGFK